MAARQDQQQLVFHARQIHGLPIHGDRALLGVDREAFELEFPASRCGGIRAAQYGLDTRDQFTRFEWLADIVIGTEFKP